LKAVISSEENVIVSGCSKNIKIRGVKIIKKHKAMSTANPLLFLLEI
jgi:hypothetical protein